MYILRRNIGPAAAILAIMPWPSSIHNSSSLCWRLALFFDTRSLIRNFLR